MKLNTNSKTVLLVDLRAATSEIKSFTELNPYIGGVGLGIKLFSMFKQEDPLIFCIGPLNGFFPYASKTAVILEHQNEIVDLYIGGALSLKMRFAGLDAVVFLNRSPNEVVINILDEDVRFHDPNVEIGSLGLPGKRSVLHNSILDKYFRTPDNILFDKLNNKKLNTIVITGTKVYDISEPAKYDALYKNLLMRVAEINTTPSDKPSCSNCPMGCEESKDGEVGGNILLHTMVGCQFAEPIYADIGIAFSCLNLLGYSYTHESLEKLPKLIEKTLNEIRNS